MPRSFLSERERLIKALRRESIDRYPAISIFQTATRELMKASGCYWPTANFKPDLMARLALAAHDFADLECIRFPFSLGVEAEAFGCYVDGGTEKRFPKIISPRLVDISKGGLENALNEMKNSAVIKAVRISKEKAEEIPIICSITSPFTLYGIIKGLGRVLMDIKKNPKSLHDSLGVLSQFLYEYSRALVEAGADVLAVMEYSGSGIIVGLDNFKKFVQPYLRILIERIELPIILHLPHALDRIETPLKELLKETSIAGFCLEWGVDIKSSRKVVGEEVALVGNINPAYPLLLGKPKDVEKNVEEIIEAGIDILSPGCDLELATPTENIKALVHSASRNVVQHRSAI